jgi:hypothetical protein
VVSRAAVAKLFKDNYKRGPIPNDLQADYFRNAINAVLNQPTPPSNHSKKGYRRRLATYNAMLRLVREQKKAHDILPGLRLPSLIIVEQYEEQLQGAKYELLHPYDPLAGDRKKAEWHKPARYLAKYAEHALTLAGHKTIPKTKRSSFVRLICDALELAGQPCRTPEAVAHALAKSGR